MTTDGYTRPKDTESHPGSLTTLRDAIRRQQDEIEELRDMIDAIIAASGTPVPNRCSPDVIECCPDPSPVRPGDNCKIGMDSGCVGNVAPAQITLMLEDANAVITEHVYRLESLP